MEDTTDRSPRDSGNMLISETGHLSSSANTSSSSDY